jgi:DNA helicase-2/ATP-dependent DNA helicase PcrA
MAATESKSWLNDLNDAQRRAAEHGDGPLLIVAGAGTGKTKTLAYRVSCLVARGVPPERILLLTFTRRAAEEMLKRAASVLAVDSSLIRRVWGGTFHAVANRLLRIYAQAAGLSPDFTIMDRSDAEDLVNVIRNELSLSSQHSRFPRKATCLDIYSRRVNGNIRLEEILKSEFPWCAMWAKELNALFRAYVERKLSRNLLDYDDLLLYWYHLLDEPHLASTVGGRFDHILVDEYQDTNTIESGILLGMRRHNSNITVVGDDAQSIYSFRSATVRNMLDFPAQFPGATIVTLEQNYRSRPPILSATNLVIAQARERYSKELWSARDGGEPPRLITCRDEDGQDEAVVRQVLEHYEQGIPLKQQAVLFRAASHSSSLELALARHNIPFRKYGGLRFLETAHIKDLISFLRIAENPRDEIAWFRILHLLEGVGPITAGNAFKHLSENNYDPASLLSFAAPAPARAQLTALATLLTDLGQIPDAGPSVQIERIREFYIPLLQRNYDNPEPRANDIEHLQQIAGRQRTRRDFLSELVLDPPVSTGDLAGVPSRDEDWLVLSTIHSAKGLEWDAVYVIHAADGCLPSDMATGTAAGIDEELRLTYVAMTRARDFLYVLWPLRYYSKSAGISDQHSYAQCCRFFTVDVKSAMTIMTHPADGSGEPLSPSSPPGDSRIADRLRDMWK